MAIAMSGQAGGIQQGVSALQSTIGYTPPAVIEGAGFAGSGATLAPLLATNRTMEAANLAGAGANNLVRDASRYIFTVGASGYRDVRVVLANYYCTTGEKLDGAPITVAMTTETLSPARVRAITFGGQRTVTIQPGDTVTSDPIPGGPFVGRSQIILRTDLTVATLGQLWPYSINGRLRVTGEDNRQSDSSGVAQAGNTGAIVQTGTFGALGYSPLALIGTPLATSSPADRRAVILIGDSITWGNSDVTDVYGNTGYAKGLLDSSGYPIPNTVLARDSDQSVFNIDSTLYEASRKQLVYGYGTALLSAYGTNDLAGGVSLATIQANLTALWARGKAYGLKTAQILILPRMTGAATNTPVAGWATGGTRDQLNAWILTQVGKGVLDAAINCNQYVESPTTPGCYLSSSITADGIHMLPSGYALANRAVQAWVNTI